MIITNILSDLDYFEEVAASTSRAKKYLLKHEWCKEIKKAWLFTNLGSVLCIFLFEIENTQSPEDNLLWVMEGDFPPIYLDTYNVKTTKEVIEVYIELAGQWIKAAELNQPLDDCYPFEVMDDDGLTELFKKKVFLLKTKIMDHIDDLPFDSILI